MLVASVLRPRAREPRSGPRARGASPQLTVHSDGRETGREGEGGEGVPLRPSLGLLFLRWTAKATGAEGWVMGGGGGRPQMSPLGMARAAGAFGTRPRSLGLGSVLGRTITSPDRCG